MVNGIDDIAVTNLDGLDTVETIKVCVAYRHGKKAVRLTFPTTPSCWPSAKPVYVEFAGWRTPTDKAKTWKELPPKARAYLKGHCRIDATPNCSSRLSGPAREQTIFV